MAKKTNKALRCWVQFVKKVQREEKLSYPEAMKRAKQRKDKGEKWMKGGGEGDSDDSGSGGDLYDDRETPMNEDDTGNGDSEEMSGGRRHRRRRGSRRSRRGGRRTRRRGSCRSRRTRRR